MGALILGMSLGLGGRAVEQTRPGYRGCARRIIRKVLPPPQQKPPTTTLPLQASVSSRRRPRRRGPRRFAPARAADFSAGAVGAAEGTRCRRRRDPLPQRSRARDGDAARLGELIDHAAHPGQERPKISWMRTTAVAFGLDLREADRPSPRDCRVSTSPLEVTRGFEAGLGPVLGEAAPAKASARRGGGGVSWRCRGGYLQTTIRRSGGKRSQRSAGTHQRYAPEEANRETAAVKGTRIWRVDWDRSTGAVRPMQLLRSRKRARPKKGAATSPAKAQRGTAGKRPGHGKRGDSAGDRAGNQAVQTPRSAPQRPALIRARRSLLLTARFHGRLKWLPAVISTAICTGAIRSSSMESTSETALRWQRRLATGPGLNKAADLPRSSNCRQDR